MMPLIRIGFESGFMNVRSIIAAAAVVVGFGQGANAAVLESGYYQIGMTVAENY